MGSVEVAGVAVGDVTLDWPPMAAAAQTLDQGIQSLRTDVDDNLVYTDPASLRASAKTFADLAASAPTEEIRKAQQAIADSQNAEADRLEARAKVAGPAKASAQETFGEQYAAFVSSWEAWAKSNNATDPSLTAHIGDNPWEFRTQLNQFDTEYRQFVAQYTDLAGKPPTLVPPKPGENPNATDWTTWIPWAVAIAAIGAVAWLISSVRRIA